MNERKTDKHCRARVEDSVNTNRHQTDSHTVDSQTGRQVGHQTDNTDKDRLEKTD
jgi:hypothetical protein